MPDVEEKLREALHNSADTFAPQHSLSLSVIQARARGLRARLLITTVIVSLLIASGTFLLVRTAGSSGPSGSFISPNGNNNIKVAQEEVSHLLDLVNVPPGSTRSQSPSSTPSSPQSAEYGSHSTSGSRSWIVPLAMRDAFEWIFQHHPAGLRLENWGAGKNGSHITTYGATWGDVDTQSYVQPQLNVNVYAPDSRHSRVQAQASATWLGPPAEDRPGHQGAPPLRVTFASGCPDAINQFASIVNPPSAELHTRLLFAKKPSAALRCLYGETDRLLTSTRLDASAASELADKISNLTLGSPGPGRFFGCFQPTTPDPTMPGNDEIIVFRYPGKPDVDLWHSRFCSNIVDNGFIHTSVWGPAF
jgi:hypothetical protein